MGSDTTADLRCGDSVIASAPLVVLFCSGAAAAVVYSTMLALMSIVKTITVVLVPVCLVGVAESIVSM